MGQRRSSSTPEHEAQIAPLDAKVGPDGAPDADTGIDWLGELKRRWDALGEELFGLDGKAARPSIEEILGTCSQLTVVWALVNTNGVLGRAAMRLGCSRRTIRRHAVRWAQNNPDLRPPPYEAGVPDDEGEMA